MDANFSTGTSPDWPGLFIAFEGIDGAGKTTQVQRLAEFCQAGGVSVVCTKEPTDGPWGRKIREAAASHRLPFHEELQAFINDRQQHLAELILPALHGGKVVITDRYLYSTAAYQGSRAEGNPNELLQTLTAEAPRPDFVFLLDVPAETGLERVSSVRGDIPDAFETTENLRAVRAAFQTLLADEHAEITAIDGMQSIDDVFTEIRQAILHKSVQRVTSTLSQLRRVE